MFRILNITVCGLLLLCGLILVVGFFGDEIGEKYKLLFGVSVLIGWVLAAFSILSYACTTILWLVLNVSWYWRSFCPINFGLILWAAAFLKYNKDDGFVAAIIINIIASITAYLLFKRNIHQYRAFSFLALLCLIPNISYLVFLYVGSVIVLLNIFEINAQKLDSSNLPTH